MEYYLTSMRWLLISVVMTLFCLYAVDVCDVAVGSTTARTVVSALLVGGAWGEGRGLGLQPVGPADGRGLGRGQDKGAFQLVAANGVERHLRG